MTDMNEDLQGLDYPDTYPVSHSLALELAAQFEPWRSGMYPSQLSREQANLMVLNNMLHRTVKAVRDLEVRLAALEKPNED